MRRFLSTRLRLLLGGRASVPQPQTAASAEPATAPPPVFATPLPADRIDRLAACPACGGAESSAVLSFNKLILSPSPPDAASYRYRYAICHDCGVVSARRRPAGARYAWMLEHFEETLGRVEFGTRRSGKVALTSYELSEAEKHELVTRAQRGVFVSDHEGLGPDDYLPALMNDRLANSMHVELLGSLLPLQNARVLEVRSRLGSISAALQRLYGATAKAMALFPNQQVLIEEVYRIPASVGIDYDQFEIPFEGAFELIVANHMLTHAISPKAMLRTLHDRLAPGGHLYVFNEPDERAFLASGKSIFNTMNPFHMQAFDATALRCMLEANGFRVSFIKAHGGSLMCLASKGEFSGQWTRVPETQRRRRRARYRRAQDVASLLLPAYARDRVDEPWDALLARGVAEGLVDVNRKGTIKVREARRGESSPR